MKAILVDDEALASHYLRRQLEKIGGIHILAELRDAQEAVDQAESLKPDVAFLDIDMPALGGIEAAEILQMRDPNLKVVFVTAYDDYAIKAFELNAIDYLLKPVNAERLKRTVERLKLSLPQAVAAGRPEASDIQPVSPVSASPAMLRCFQTLELDNGKLESIPWRTFKAQELFSFLLLHREQLIRKDMLLELLWPEVDYKKGYTQLYTTAYQIRKTIAALDVTLVLKSNEKGYKLEVNGLPLDIEVWEQGVMGTPALTKDTLDHHLALTELYRGDYLADYDYLWAESERQRLRYLWFRHTSEVATLLAQVNRVSEAIHLYNQLLDKFPHAEELHFELMKLYRLCG
ncbi:response regulator, partial [Paenibacillus sepulcri]|nr:response regulator [Paenibacillus sepulcri]